MKNIIMLFGQTYFSFPLNPLYWLVLFGWTAYVAGSTSPNADLAIWVGWLGHLLPFVGVILLCLLVITYVPALSLGLRDLVYR